MKGLIMQETAAQVFRYNVCMRLSILFLFSLIFTGCASKVPPVAEQQVMVHQDRARELMQNGDYPGAAEEYLRLARLDARHAVTFQLKAASAYIKAGSHADAQNILDAAEIDSGERTQILRRSVLYAYLELEQGRPERVLQQLGQTPGPDTPRELLILWYEIRAEAQVRTGAHAEAVRGRLELDRYLNSLPEKEYNYRKIWGALKALSLQMLESRRAESEGGRASWYELGILYKTMRYDAQKFRHAVDGWIQRYPDHPAYADIVPMLIAESERLGKQPEHIAVLLPFSGPYLKVSKAIRDGFIAAWYEQGDKRPQLSVYDADSLNVVGRYRQAIEAGADFVVGPLEKEAIRKLAETDLPDTGILTLNHIDDAPESIQSKLIQFGLAPEDEAEQVAERAWFDGHALALVLTPNNLWGERIYSAFKAHWERLGGKILEHGNFTSSAQDYAETAKRILNIDSSELRLKQLKNRLRLPLKFEIRIREDADFIFLAATPDAARQLVPQLQFYRAGRIPVYSTSHVFSGVVDAGKDIDIDGIRFVDIPWLLDIESGFSSVRDSLNKNWNVDESNYRRLYALGIDAYRLIPLLGRLSEQRDFYLEGETGDLSMTEDGKIKRRLRWARFSNGSPVLSE